MFGLPLGMVIRIAAALAVIGGLLFFAHYFSAKGASDERSKIVEGSAIVQANTQESLVTHHDEAIERTRASAETLEQTQQAVWASQGADTPLPEEVVSVWVVGIDRLRNEARCRRDRADCPDSARMESGLRETAYS